MKRKFRKRKKRQKPREHKHMLMHFRKRLWQRENITELKEHEIQSIHSQIKKETGILIEQQTSTRSIWCVVLRDQPIWVVFNTKVKFVATVLSFEMIKDRWEM